jgi:two-component system, chemotaxis family, response regulator Rcp1
MKTVQIVLIEDNPADVELVKLALREAGVKSEITLYSNGKDALRDLAAPDFGFEPSAILLDLNTPGTDGFEVHLKLRQDPRLSQVPIAILTSSRARADKHRAAIQGARYVEKPSQLQDFLTTVGELVKELLEPA